MRQIKQSTTTIVIVLLVIVGIYSTTKIGIRNKPNYDRSYIWKDSLQQIKEKVRKQDEIISHYQHKAFLKDMLIYSDSIKMAKMDNNIAELNRKIYLLKTRKDEKKKQLTSLVATDTVRMAHLFEKIEFTP